MENKQKQELHCHACNCYVQFELDLSLNGNHVLKCPKCKHEHCRVIKDGVITDGRWDQRNGNTPNNGMPIYAIATTSFTASSVMDTMQVTTANAGTGSLFLANAWLNTSTNIGTSTYTGITVV